MTLGQIPQHILRGVIDDDHLRDIAERNKARAEQVIERMGIRYCCHPANRLMKVRRVRFDRAAQDQEDTWAAHSHTEE